MLSQAVMAPHPPSMVEPWSSGELGGDADVTVAAATKRGKVDSILEPELAVETLVTLPFS